jgi:uncharacterized membrane protein
MEYLVVKWLHILSSTLLFGTGIGTAWYMLHASLSRDARAAAVVLRHGVRADWLFTATTVVFQPLSGLYLVHLAGFPLGARWIFWSIVLYFVAGACWLPVVWIQIRMRNLAVQAAANGGPLPAQYFAYLRVWAALGVPAFLALVIVFWLMTAKPTT